MRQFATLFVALFATVLGGCSSCPDTRAGAAPGQPSRVYTPPCPGGNYDRPAGDEVYTPSDCNPWETFKEQFSQIKSPFRGYPFTLLGAPECEPTPPATFVPDAPAAAPQPHCGPLPADAKPGEVWCCTFVQPPAAPPQRVCVCEEKVCEIPVPATYKTVCEQVQVAAARQEWQPIKCGDGTDECWVLVDIPAAFKTVEKTVEATPASVRREVIPAQFEMRASAPPPGYWEWQLRADCRPVPAAAAPDCPPAGR